MAGRGRPLPRNNTEGEEPMIKKQGSSYVVKSKDGKKTLGSHKTHAAAAAQLSAIEISKRRKDRKKAHEDYQYSAQVDAMIRESVDKDPSPHARRGVAAEVEIDNIWRRKIAKLAAKNKRSEHAQEFYGTDNPPRPKKIPASHGMDSEMIRYARQNRKRKQERK